MEASLDVSVAPDAVFARVCDLDWCAREVTGLLRVERVQEPTDGTRFGPGLIWRETREMFGQEATETMEVRAVDAARRAYTVGSVSCGMDYTSVIRVEPAPGGCTLRFSMRGEPLGCVARVAAWLVLPLLGGMMRAMLRRDLEDIKRAIEREAAAAAAS